MEGLRSSSSSYEVRSSSSYQSTAGGGLDAASAASANQAPFVKPIMSNRSVVVNRSGPFAYSSMRLTSGSRYGGGMGGSGTGSMPGSGYYAAVSTTGVNSVKESREKEKRDMQDLNEKFANYLEKVRFLEAQNRKLASELEKLKAKWGKETSQIKAMYEVELEEARKLLDDTVKEKARLEIKVASLEDEVAELKQR